MCKWSCVDYPFPAFGFPIVVLATEPAELAPQPASERSPNCENGRLGQESVGIAQTREPTDRLADGPPRFCGRNLQIKTKYRSSCGSVNWLGDRFLC